MQRILITTDLSDESQVAFSHGRLLAEKFGSEVDVLAIIEDPAHAAMLYALDNPVLPSQEVQEQFKQKINTDLEKLVEKHLEGITTRCHVVEADQPVHDAIIDFLKEHGSDLIIIATHGRTGLKRLLIGSVAERVVRECPCPVLTVPSHP